MVKMFCFLLLWGHIAHAQTEEIAHNLDGKWVQTHVDCKGGKLNKKILSSNQPISLEIRGHDVIHRNKTNLAKKGFCEVTIRENWEITKTTYKVLNAHITQQKEYGGKCIPEKLSPSGDSRRYEIQGDILLLDLPFVKNLCQGGKPLVTYRRIAH